MNNDISILNELLEEKKYQTLRNALVTENPADIAAFIDSLPKGKNVLIFRMLPKDIAVDVFAELFTDSQQAVIETLDDDEISEIVNDLFTDDAVDFIEEMPAGIVKKVLSNASPEARERINQILKYPENSAGSMMTVEFVDLEKSLTVHEAFEKIRRTGTDKETIYTCYVINSQRHLEGIVSIRKLLLSEPDAKVEDIMDITYISAKTMDDREAVAYQVKKYGLLSIPVVDSEERLVGIITVDDVIDVFQEEATEDIEKMAAMIPSEKPYLKTSVLSLTKNRIIWLLVLMFSGMITGTILSNYEVAIAAIPLLVSFIPMMTDTGGNAGSQSSAVIIRGLALQEIKRSDVLKILFKEIRVSMLAGLLLSIINFIRICIQYPGQPMLALTVAISLMCTVVLAQTLGGLLPILAKTLKLDPTVMAAPLVTTIVDAVSLVIYFNMAQVLLRHLM